jgi:hypothetical protein
MPDADTLSPVFESFFLRCSFLLLFAFPTAMASKKRPAAALDAAPDVELESSDKSVEKKAKFGKALSVTLGAPGSAAAAASSSSSVAAAASAPSSSAQTPAAYSALAAAHSERFQRYTKETQERAHRILHTILPRKVLELDAQLQTHPTFEHNVSPPYDAEGKFLPGRDRDPIVSNPSLALFIPLVKREILEMIDLLGSLKLMIQLRIPAVDDGNNFGVEIQEESIGELAKVEDVAFAWLDKVRTSW